MKNTVSLRNLASGTWICPPLDAFPFFAWINITMPSLSLVPRCFHEYYLKYVGISERAGVLGEHPRALTYSYILQVVLMKAPGYMAGPLDLVLFIISMMYPPGQQVNNYCRPKAKWRLWTCKFIRYFKTTESKRDEKYNYNNNEKCHLPNWTV